MIRFCYRVVFHRARGLPMAVLWLCGSIHQPAGAQQPPAPPSLETQQLQLQQQREEGQRRSLDSTPDIRRPAPPPPTGRLRDDETPCVVIRELRLGGAYADSFRWLIPAASGTDADDAPIGRCLGDASIALIQARMQGELVRRGYVTSRVLARAQNLAAAGVLELTVVPGLLHGILLAPANGVPRTAAAAIPSSVGEALRLRDIEQGLENLKRIPGAEADIEIVPAEATDAESAASDLLVHYRAGRAWRANLSVDDGGTRATGRRQGVATLFWDNPLALNDQLSLSLGRSLEHRDSRATGSTALNYSLPWGYWLIGASASRNRYRQSVAGASQDYVFSGVSDNAELRLQRVVWRSASARTSLGLRTARRSSASFIDDTEIEVQHRVTALWELSATHRHFVGDAVVDGSLALRRGTGAYGAQPAPEEPFGEGTSRMRLAIADLAYTQPLRWGDQRWRVSSAWHAQWNRTPLTPQDRIAIGSRYTVRGFDGESFLLAERGWFWRNELAWSVAEGHEAYLGLDGGRVGGPSAASLAGRSLVGGVLGVRGSHAGLSYEVFVGKPLHKPARFNTAHTAVGFNVSYAL